MPRTVGGGAAGAMEARDRAAIKKRELTSKEVTVPKIGLLPDSQFPEPPGRRLTPWTQQNASGTDIIVGSCNEKGVFEGLMLTDVQMQVLMRYFSMASTYMPRDAPPQLSGLAAQLRDGMATLVVTRGSFGRELDEGNGPARNAATSPIWQACREARIMNPSLHITCLDVPANITGAQLSKVLTQPLSDHRELAYYEGVWYIPSVVSNPGMAKQIKEVSEKNKPLWHTRVAAMSGSGSNGGSEVIFNRKKFEWRDSEKATWFHLWKPVYTDENYVKSDVPIIDRDFTGPSIHNGGGAAPADAAAEIMDMEAEGQE